ncbi:hypothetical protein CPAR01_05617 [Colletotrichum paranaense]|uniref:Uncharacterized protein n=3 Tax=Colletotrichum acutatum species complex TaxID=2707335 RepID=A0A9Q8SZA8_9PEZI|nr:hypothetical protein CSPX01_10356 [Colletotrichum filicis]KAK1450229.1 hypothetical protein CMEL01_07565 [Colletotrichum melonis]KAK1542230.1 hypothetical protein CPAR01_05617 [Colletotrichum paranaense]UQC86359.1 hypothetical protein CLUP02_11859 [Colletotrichum lupini]
MDRGMEESGQTRRSDGQQSIRARLTG